MTEIAVTEYFGHPNNPRVAHVVDHEGEGPKGEGKDDLEALKDLAYELAFKADDALFECLARIMEESIHPGTDFNRMGLQKAASILRGMV
jgi:hypothetical protein